MKIAIVEDQKLSKIDCPTTSKPTAKKLGLQWKSAVLMTVSISLVTIKTI